MWARFLQYLQCPQCEGTLKVHAFEQSSETIGEEHLQIAKTRGIALEDLSRWIESGAIQCRSCRVTFPIWRGLPILLPYTTAAHRNFQAECAKELGSLSPNYPFPDREPVPGERFVLSSFSKEWLEYDFDGVIWTANYEDYRRTFLLEVGHENGETATVYLEVGCGIGITTSIAQQTFGGDALGIDLSLAAMKACGHWRANPFMQFVQASAFYLPARERAFDVVYSRGALHHTYSTREAFQHVAGRCKPGGRAYLWVYGSSSITQNLFRKLAYAAEAVFRPLLSRISNSVFSTACLSIFALAYMGFSSLRRLRNPEMQPYTFRRAMHAARDRFTPQFAHRHEPKEVDRWFQEFGFSAIEILPWQQMPAAEQENFQRNVGVRGWKVASEAKGLVMS